ncbi:MFS transporter [Auritidibacter ignavus]|uniref:MFS transporter n=1 Tax=Auritidibacter ignavus TaxID=678932 RepID=A0AAJ6AP57_9MICC|nr:MFS transporter [Auritidibacter ignavus]WGH93550.1 MFS transporter [Auritidibacter ignavus]
MSDSNHLTSPDSRVDATEAESVMDPPLRMVTIGLLLSVGIVAFDGLGVTTALPRIASELGGLNTYGWAVSALMLASVVGTVIGGYMADRRGPRAPYIVGLMVFTMGLMMSATVTTWTLFLLGRVMQGLGVGAIMSMAYYFVAVVYPQALHARALALLSAAWTVPALVGPMASSTLAELSSWRLLFIILAPLALVAGSATLRGMPPLGAAKSQSDNNVVRQLVFSTGLAIGAAVLLTGLEQDSPTVVAAMVCLGAVVMILTLRQVTPKGTLTVRRGVPAGIVTRATLSVSFFGIETFLPLAMTELRGASLIVAGLTLAAGALVWVAGSMAQSRHEMRKGPATRRGDIVVGLVTLAVGIIIIAVTLLNHSIPIHIAIIGWVIGGFGMGLAYNASTSETFSETQPEAIGEMSGTIQMAQTLGTAVIAGTGTALISATHASSGGLATAMTAIFVVTASFALAAIPAALRIRRHSPGKTTRDSDKAR